MSGRVQLLLLAFLVLISFRPGDPGPPVSHVLKLYHKADSLLNLPNPTSITDKEALNGFEQLIDQLEKYPQYHNDSFLFLSYMKKGILMDVQANYAAATKAYRKALDLRHAGNNTLDSLTFMTCVNAGASYYNLNDFDSANYFLLKAESMISSLVANEDKLRLYNTLGVLYHDNGNYLQSKNYFSQALEIVKSQQPVRPLAVVSIETNIATSFYKLGQYDQALSIYKDALKYKVSANYIYMNIGRANNALKKYNEALASFRKVNTAEIPWVYNEIGYAQLQLGRPDSAAYFLDQLQLHEKNSNLNLIDRAINESYRADLLAAKQKYIPALNHLQQSIIIFSGNFKDKDIYSNPSNFTGTFAYYRLFDALYKKAEFFSSLYKKNMGEEYLHASFSAFQSALSLIEYIEKSYDTDDAKILLKKKSREVYQKALSVCLELYKSYPKENYLEQAFLISEKNKASIVAANLKENTFNNIPGIEKELLEKERNIKYNIARLDIESDQAKDTKVVESLASEKAKYEIELSRVQKNFEKNNHYYKLKYDNSFPGVKELQQHLTDKQAVISFYTTNEAMHVFAVTQTSFAYTRIDTVDELQHAVEDWIKLLKTTENGRKFAGEKTGNSIYERLVKPISSMVNGKDEWIIIPDGILYFLPFESLPSGNDSKTLLETTTISYQFSSRFIINQNGENEKTDGSYSVLSFAPFVRRGIENDQPGAALMNQLPASGEEISGLNGEQFIDSMATKENFLKEINKYPVVHLASHAVSDINNTSASFIAFYPKKKSSAQDYLFLEELYGLNMDSTQLVIISACETGDGELVNNEGVISLARAFIYAGCSSTVNSLWKADDKSTAAILRQFHVYLEKGYTKSKALRQAKLDYIRSNSLYKSPAYWSHLILIGDDEPVCFKKQYYKGTVIAVLSFCCVFFVLVKRKEKKKKKSTLSTDAGF